MSNENNQNFLHNLIRLNFWCTEDCDRSVQELDYDNNGPKLYFKQFTGDNDKREFTGVFLPDRKNADILTEFDETILKDFDKLLEGEIEEPKYDGIRFKITSDIESDSLNMDCAGVGKYKDKQALDEFYDYILDFLDQGEVNIHSIAFENNIDLKLDHDTEQDLIRNAKGLYNYLRESDQLMGALEILSPESAKTSTFIGAPEPPFAPDGAGMFLLFTDQDKATDFMEMMAESRKIGKGDRNDFLLIEIIPKLGEFVLRDQAFGELKNLTDDEKREMILNFLTICKEINEV